MNHRGRVSLALCLAFLPGMTFAQAKVDRLPKPSLCTVVHRSGRRIVSLMDIVEFHVPLFAHVKTAADVDYVVYNVRYGPESNKLWLQFMFGPMVGGYMPRDLENPAIKWTALGWDCELNRGTDWRGAAADGRRWRHLTVPFGFATYQGVPPKAAAYFDKILDTMCCGKRPCSKLR